MPLCNTTRKYLVQCRFAHASFDLILPGLLRIRPGLIPLVVGLLAVFVAYGRWRLTPHHGSAGSLNADSGNRPLAPGS
jgi:hypothetical protein